MSKEKGIFLNRYYLVQHSFASASWRFTMTDVLPEELKFYQKPVIFAYL